MSLRAGAGQVPNSWRRRSDVRVRVYDDGFHPTDRVEVSGGRGLSGARDTCDGSVGGEGLSVNGMGLDGSGLRHGLGRQGRRRREDMRGLWTQCTE